MDAEAYLDEAAVVAAAVDAGDWLVENRRLLDSGEARWLERLAEFDRDELWALDGHSSCISWLVWRAGMARSTAFEKLRVAQELRRRPVVAEAFRRGQLSYSAVRIITRMDRPDPAVDETIVDLVASGQATILDLERIVRCYQLYAEQELPPADEERCCRDVRVRRSADGSGQVTVSLGPLELAELLAAQQAFLDLRYRRGVGAVDESPAGDYVEAAEAPLEEATRAARRADAFMDLVRSGLAGCDGGHAAGDDRYMVHLVTRAGGSVVTHLDGAPVHPVNASMVACDRSSVTHVTGDGGEPLQLGRKTREWNTAQRRAISVSDGGQCRFPGCTFTHYDIHHMRSWEDGGSTDVDNGFCQCRRHHRMLHSGYRVEGSANGELRFYRAGGTYIASTYPAAARTLPL